jgi:type VI secretion system protein ImpA
LPSLLARSKDLRVAVYLCRALLHNEGFVGGVKGLALIEALLETFWDGLHPELDADDNDDPTMRLNALVPLGALEAVVGDLRASYVMRSRGRGELRVRDIEIAQGRLPAGGEGAALTESQLAGLIAAAVDENPGCPSARRMRWPAPGASSGFSARVGEAYAPDFKLLQAALFSVSKAFGGAVPAGAGEAPGWATATSRLHPRVVRARRWRWPCPAKFAPVTMCCKPWGVYAIIFPRMSPPTRFSWSCGGRRG